MHGLWRFLWRCGARRGRVSPPGLQHLLLFLVAGRTFAADLRWNGCDWSHGMGHAQHLVGELVCFILKRVVDPTDRKLWLYRQRAICPVRGKQWDPAEIP